MRTVWNEKGDAEGFVTFTTRAGRVVGRPTARKRAAARIRRLWNANARRAILSETIENDHWMAWHNGALVESVADDVFTHALFTGL